MQAHAKERGECEKACVCVSRLRAQMRTPRGARRSAIPAPLYAQSVKGAQSAESHTHIHTLSNSLTKDERLPFTRRKKRKESRGEGHIF